MNANCEHKASLFSSLFNDPEKLRILYNAIADTNYDENTPVEINTLDDILFKDQMNDISFIIGGKSVVLIEHQSTVSDNIPLRCLMYIGRLYEKIA
ncbi:MAG: hypothetical protein LBD23_16595, partial [Oscillospiraceae bacterium]|nr:hypothetical protein [Oscillospiraceae bacterium]